jgi:dTDP-4-amino-4,6-dideoxygalactose transaminase
MPNINAALLVAQIENLPLFLENKRKTAQFYRNLADEIGFELMWQGEGTHANFWLNTVRLKNKEQRDRFLEESHQNGIGCRPIWQLMHHTPMYKNCERGDLSISEILVNQIVNLPSSYNPKA